MKKSFSIDLLTAILWLYMFTVGFSTSLLEDKLISRQFIEIFFSVILVFYILFVNRYTKKKLLFYIVMILLFLVAGYQTRRVYMLTYALFIMAAANHKSFPTLIKATVAGIGLSRLIVLILSQIGVIPDIIYSRENENYDIGFFYSGISHCFGYNWFHFIPYTFFFVSLCLMYLKKREMSWPEIGLWALSHYVVYYYCEVRLALYLGLFSLVLYVVLVKLNWIQINNSFVKWGLTASFPLAMFISIFVAMNYDSANPFYFALNQFLSGRINLAKVAFTRYPITLFGQYIQTYGIESSHEYFYLDSGYIFTLLGYGVLLSTVVILMYSCLCWYACKRKDKVLFIWLVCTLLFTFSNNGWIYLEYNPILLAFPFVWNEEFREKLRSRQFVLLMDSKSNTYN